MSKRPQRGGGKEPQKTMKMWISLRKMQGLQMPTSAPGPPGDSWTRRPRKEASLAPTSTTSPQLCCGASSGGL